MQMFRKTKSRKFEKALRQRSAQYVQHDATADYFTHRTLDPALQVEDPKAFRYPSAANSLPRTLTDTRSRPSLDLPVPVKGAYSSQETTVDHNDVLHREVKREVSDSEVDSDNWSISSLGEVCVFSELPDVSPLPSDDERKLQNKFRRKAKREQTSEFAETSSVEGEEASPQRAALQNGSEDALEKEDSGPSALVKSQKQQLRNQELLIRAASARHEALEKKFEAKKSALSKALGDCTAYEKEITAGNQARLALEDRLRKKEHFLKNMATDLLDIEQKVDKLKADAENKDALLKEQNLTIARLKKEQYQMSRESDMRLSEVVYKVQSQEKIIADQRRELSDVTGWMKPLEKRCEDLANKCRELSDTADSRLQELHAAQSRHRSLQSNYSNAITSVKELQQHLYQANKEISDRNTVIENQKAAAERMHDRLTSAEEKVRRRLEPVRYV